MAYDVELADRLRTLLSAEPDVTEKRMFGGLAFLVAGSLAVSASGKGGLLLRVDPARRDQLLREPHVQPFVMRGREMAGWLHVGCAAVATEDGLRRWVGPAVAYARSRPQR